MMIVLKDGDKLRLLCQFEHIGLAYTGAKIRAAIGKGGALGFKEYLKVEVPVSGIKADPTWTSYEITVDIPISGVGTLGIPVGSDYEVYAKMLSIPGDDLFWYGPENDITLAVVVQPADFQDLTVVYQKA